MIITDKPVSVQSSGISREAFFSVKMENAPHLFSVLRNQLYSDKHMAIVREYATNAADAHVQAGCPNRPIQVTLPTLLNPMLSIRDFGTGLSEEDIFDIFASYGASTKRNTNEQTGMLGLGSKSAFSYVNAFTVISFHTGVRSVYEAYIDETGLGKISLLLAEPTQEEDGLEIRIQVEKDPWDIGRFGTAAANLFRFWPVRPELRNAADVESVLASFDSHMMRQKLASGDGWCLVDKNFVTHVNKVYSRLDNKVLCVMGNVSYGVSMEYLGEANKLWLNSIPYHVMLMLHLPIGTVQPTASREELDYNERTVKALQHHVARAKQELLVHANSMLERAETLWEARCIANDMKALIQGLSNSLMWQGKPVPVGAVHFGQNKEVDVRVYDPERYKWKKSDRYSFFPSQRTMIFVGHDGLPKNSRIVRITQYMEGRNLYLSDHKCVYVHFDTEEQAKAWADSPEMSGASLTHLQDLPYTPTRKARASKGGDSTTKLKSLVPAFVYNGKYGWPVKSKAWDTANVDLEEGEGVYILLNAYLPHDLAGCDNLNDLGQALSYLQTLGCKPDKLYGFKKAVSSKIGKGWKPLQKYMEEQILARMRSAEDVKELHQHWITSNVRRNYFSYEWLDKLSEGAMARFLRRIEPLKSCGMTQHSYAIHNLSSQFEDLRFVYAVRMRELCLRETESMYKEVCSSYPLLGLIPWHAVEQAFREHADEILDYIALVDGRA